MTPPRTRAHRLEILGNSPLYGILDTSYTPPDNMEAMTTALLQGGIRTLQLRMKDSPAAEIERLARRLLPICQSANALFLINDHPAIAAACGADGAHVGQDDISPSAARSLIGEDAVLGLSTHSLGQASAARSEPVDYIGFGPLFATPTKPEYIPVGTGDIAAVCRLSRVPVFCIGGIKLENLDTVIDAGARHAVIVSGLLLADNPAAAAAACIRLLARSRETI